MGKPKTKRNVIKIIVTASVAKASPVLHYIELSTKPNY
jgi:hypothetical protein